jgi:hypothetical protein
MKEYEPKRFEVMMRMHPNGEIEKKIFIDGQMMDYSIDVHAFREACKMGLQYKLAVQRDIAKHFIDCVSDMVGRKVTIEELKQAMKTGWI